MLKTNLAALCVIACGSLQSLQSFAQSPPPELTFIEDGRAGFVISHIEYALTKGAEIPGACPSGLSLHIGEVFARTAEGRRRPGESDGAYSKRLDAGGRAMSVTADGKDLCMNPEATSADFGFRVLELADLPGDGLDLDGDASGRTATPPSSCPHRGFIDASGQPSIDNQFARVVGCTRSFQPNGISNSFAVEMLSGSWGILITLDGVDDIHNDNDVRVGIFANADPIQLSPARVPLEYATYAMDQDPEFRAFTRGRIENGVLISEPVDVKFHSVVNSMRFQRKLRDARLRVSIAENGTLQGHLAGYTSVSEMYDSQFAFRNGKNSAGELAPLQLRSATGNGAARVLGYTCPGIYQALLAHADGYPDPSTGKCSSISSQFRIQAIPAFVVDTATTSTNASLLKGSMEQSNVR